MYSVAVQKQFTAFHFLIGGDWGAENERHAHNYRVEVRLSGETLDPQGYLVDIIEIETNLEECTHYFAEKTLNNLPEFTNLNPSLEHFARIFLQRFQNSLKTENLSSLEVQLWENEEAWASYRCNLR